MSGMNRIGRRRFVQLMGWAGAAAVARGGPALAQAARKPKAARPPEPSPTPAPPGAEPEVSEEARSLAEVVRRRHGEHLSPHDLETITSDLDGDLRGMRRLREVRLANSEEPDSTFRA